MGPWRLRSTIHSTTRYRLSRPDPLRNPVRFIEEVLHTYLQGFSNRIQHRDCWIRDARLDATHVGAKHPGTVGQLLLRNAQRCAQLLDPQSQGFIGCGLA